MAQIALITKTLNSQVLTTAKGLSEQRQEVLVITGADQVVPSNYDFQVLTFFKKWNGFEAARLIPRLLTTVPQIFHFFFESEAEIPTWAHWTLGSFAKNLRRSVIVSFGGGKIDSKNWRRNRFLRMSHTVIAPSREKLMQLKRAGLIGENVLSEVVLPFPEVEADAQESSESAVDFLNHWQPFVLVPSQAESPVVHLLSEAFQATGHRLVFLGPRPESLYADLRCLTIGHPSEYQLKKIAQMSSAILLAFHEYEPVELMRWQQLAAQLERPLIVLQKQIELLPGLCLHEKNGFVLGNLKDDFRRLLHNNPNLEITRFESHLTRTTPSDQSLNEVSRLYARTLASRVSN